MSTELRLAGAGAGCGTRAAAEALPQGIGIVYTAESRALATVEYLVHVPLSLVPHNLSIATLHIPDWVPSNTIGIGDPPANWRDYPAPPALADLGMRWALSRETLLLHVPSAVVAHEWNVLINPLYSDMPHVTIAQVEPYPFEARVLRHALM